MSALRSLSKEVRASYVVRKRTLRNTYLSVSQRMICYTITSGSERVRNKRCVMATPIKLLDVVALTADLPEYSLSRGQVGTVVEILADGSAFEVEFSDREGRTYESVGLRPEQIMVLHYEPLTAPPSPAQEPA